MSGYLYIKNPSYAHLFSPPAQYSDSKRKREQEKRKKEKERKEERGQFIVRRFLIHRANL